MEVEDVLLLYHQNSYFYCTIYKYMRVLYILFSILILGSCQKQVTTDNENKTEQALLSVVQSFKKPDDIMPQYKKEVESWTHYRNLTSFMERFEKASANEVLSNAMELETMVKTLKDSVIPNPFNGDALKARINILHNESLRLSDMTNIPAITTTEVIEQTKKTINAYSSVNSKINTILTKKKFEDAVQIDVKYIGLDSTKIDSVSRKTLKNIEAQRDSLELQQNQKQ